MKGFIEVHTTDGGVILINVNAIEAVEDGGKISVIGSVGWWCVKETYEQLVCKIKKAVEE